MFSTLPQYVVHYTLKKKQLETNMSLKELQTDKAFLFLDNWISESQIHENKKERSG